MGCYLSAANTDKDTHHEDSPFLPYAVCNMQGWRRNQEDAHIALPDFDPEKSLSLFAVFDGHGGAEVAIFCERHFGTLLKSCEAYQQGDYALALRTAFSDTDAALRNSFQEICAIHDEHEIKQTTINDEFRTRVQKAQAPPSSSSSSASASSASASSASSASSAPNTTTSPASSSSTPATLPVAEEQEDPDLSEGVDVGNGLIVARGLLVQLAQQAADDAIEHPEDYDKNDYVDIAGYELPRLLVNQLYAAMMGDEEDEDDDDDDDDDKDADQDAVAAAAANDIKEQVSSDGGNSDGTAGSSTSSSFDPSIVISDDDDDRPSYASGCTAVVILIDRARHTVYVANCGDSRIVLSRDGTAVPLSEDHKPEDDVEVKRIEHAGGHVTEEGRINGCLNLSRALGDLRYKTNVSLREDEQIISGTPDVVKCVLNPMMDEYLLLMCDGITGSYENQEVVDEVRSLINNHQLAAIATNNKDAIPSGGGDAKTVAANLNIPVPTVDGAMLSRVCGDVCDYCVAEDIDQSEDGSGCDNETFMVVRLTDMFSEAQKQAAAATTGLNFNCDPNVVELPALTLKRKAAPTTAAAAAVTDTTTNNQEDGQSNEEPSAKRRKTD